MKESDIISEIEELKVELDGHNNLFFILNDIDKYSIDTTPIIKRLVELMKQLYFYSNNMVN